MSQLDISLPVSRVFPKNGQRYLCQFLEQHKDYFTTDCAFDDFDNALSYTSLVVRFLNQIAAGKVLDAKTKQEVFTCASVTTGSVSFRQVISQTNKNRRLGLRF